jgi:acetolactate synthase-1/2/3 large subunit
MNGAQALLRTLVASGVDTCFMNPGTSEMHFVAALDTVAEMRPVLALFEGVASGAADGYARMSGRPASVLLHLGPGLANAGANLHNARRAASPVVAVVGDHATYHERFDAPLQSDIRSLASNFSGWYARPASVDELSASASAAVAAAYGPPGRVATLVLPADVSWSDGALVSPPAQRERPAKIDDATVERAAAALRSGRPTAFLVGGPACRADLLGRVASVAALAGARVICETLPARLERGGGRFEPERLAYLAEIAMTQLEGLEHLILVGAAPPVSFFAYPSKPSWLVPPGCEVHHFASSSEDCSAGVDALACLVGDGNTRGATRRVGVEPRPQAPESGPLDSRTLGQAVAALLPDDAIVSDESISSGLAAFVGSASAGPHDWLTLSGGAIGQGLPLALGAAVACPGRRVLALQADGSAMYTPQALWSMAREGADVTVVILSNRSYAILNMELGRVEASAGGDRARRMLDIGDPDIDFVALAAGLGVPARRASDAGELSAALAESFATPGPSLIEADLRRR